VLASTRKLGSFAMIVIANLLVELVAALHV
jgi:hypothetical protein